MAQNSRWSIAVRVWWWLLVADIVLNILPFAATYILCAVNGSFGGCGDIILLFAPVYLVSVPAFPIILIGLLVALLLNARRKRAR